MKKQQTFQEQLKAMTDKELENFFKDFTVNQSKARRMGKTETILNAQREILSEMERRGL